MNILKAQLSQILKTSVRSLNQDFEYHGVQTKSGIPLSLIHKIDYKYDPDHNSFSKASFRSKSIVITVTCTIGTRRLCSLSALLIVVQGIPYLRKLDSFAAWHNLC